MCDWCGLCWFDLIWVGCGLSLFGLAWCGVVCVLCVLGLSVVCWSVFWYGWVGGIVVFMVSVSVYVSVYVYVCVDVGFCVWFGV